MKNIELCIDRNDNETLKKIQDIFESGLSTYDEMGFDSCVLTVVVIPLASLTIQALALTIQIVTHQRKQTDSKEKLIDEPKTKNDKPKTFYLRDAYGVIHLGDCTAQEVIEIIKARNSRET